MSDLIPQRTNTTMEERIRYWDEVDAEAWELSRDLFQVHHQIGVGVVALVSSVLFRGWEVTVQELPTTVFIPIFSTVVYLTLVYFWNYTRATMRVSIRYQREANHLVQEQGQEVEKLKSTHQQTADTLRQQITALTAQLDRKAILREQRETLARHLTRSNELRNIYTSPEDVSSEPRDEWAYEVANYLQTSFDKSYFARWNDPTGIPSHFSTDKEVSKENEHFLRDIYWRTLRLRELITDLKD